MFTMKATILACLSTLLFSLRTLALADPYRVIRVTTLYPGAPISKATVVPPAPPPAEIIIESPAPPAAVEQPTIFENPPPEPVPASGPVEQLTISEYSPPAAPASGPVEQTIPAPGGPPPGCTSTRTDPFGLQTFPGSSTRFGGKSTACTGPTTLKLTLHNGVLVDSLGRIGSIVANRQFQFDGPPAQAGAVYTGGFSVCEDGALALGGSKGFWSCASGDFSNIYDQSIAPYCVPVTLEVTRLVNC